MKLKDINFDENNDLWDELTVKKKNELELIWKKYIKWKDPNDVLAENSKQSMRVPFIDGMLVGILNI